MAERHTNCLAPLRSTARRLRSAARNTRTGFGGGTQNFRCHDQDSWQALESEGTNRSQMRHAISTTRRTRSGSTWCIDLHNASTTPIFSPSPSTPCEGDFLPDIRIHTFPKPPFPQQPARNEGCVRLFKQQSWHNFF
jgi:hypothetical protein